MTCLNSLNSEGMAKNWFLSPQKNSKMNKFHYVSLFVAHSRTKTTQTTFPKTQDDLPCLPRFPGPPPSFDAVLGVPGSLPFDTMENESKAHVEPTKRPEKKKKVGKPPVLTHPWVFLGFVAYELCGSPLLTKGLTSR